MVLKLFTMKINNLKINLFLCFSAGILIITLILHNFNKNVVAQGAGFDVGGRILLVQSSDCVPPPKPPIPPCACGVFWVNYMPVNVDPQPILCITFVNFPVTGPPVYLDKIGYALLGKYAVKAPVAMPVANNWGLSMAPGF